MGAVRIVAVILRVIELLWAIIGIGTAGYLVDHDWKLDPLNMMLFTVITAMLICIFYLVVHFSAGLQRTCSGFVEAVISFIWMVFFLAASAALADSDAAKICKHDWNYSQLDRDCKTLAATMGFGFMSWLLWIGSTVLAVLEMLAGNGLQIFGVGRSNAAPAYMEGSAPVHNIQL